MLDFQTKVRWAGLMVFFWKRRPLASVEAIAELDTHWADNRASVYDTVAGALASGMDTHGAVRALFSDNGADEIRYAPGAKDALLGAEGPSTANAHSIATAICKVLRDPRTENATHLFDQLCDCHTLSVIDDILPVVQKEVGADRRPLAMLARRLLRESRELEPVKIAIALLGVSGNAADTSLISTVGSYDEYSVYAANALVDLLPDPDQELWALAKRVHGWGRIRIVERLAETNDAEIKAWMLRDGFRNSIMNEYLAYICATSGRLRDEILKEEVDDALILGAGDILSALIAGEPGTPIEEYADGGTVCLAFLKHVNARVLIDLKTISAAIAIRELVRDDDRLRGLRVQRGWAAATIMNINSEIGKILCSDAARSSIESALASHDTSSFGFGAELAHHFGIDAWPMRLARQQDLTRDPWHNQWYQLMQTNDPLRIEQVLGLARAQLNLTLIGSGPGQALGLGPEFREDNQLDFIIQDLTRFPGQGWDLIRVALRGRTNRLRNMAIKALHAWGREAWPPDAVSEIATALQREPDDKIRRRLDALANGRALD